MAGSNFTPEQGAKIHIIVNGALSLTIQGSAIKETSGSQPMKSVEKGYFGEAPGSPMVEIDLNGVIGVSGIEIWVDRIDGSQTLEIQGQCGNRQFAKTMLVVGRTLNGGVDQESKYAYSLRSGPLSWQNVPVVTA